MYVRTGNLGRSGRLAGAHRLSALRGLRGGRALGDDLPPNDASILSQAIQTAGQVATTALTPQPVTPSVTYNPTTGFYQSIGGASSSNSSGLGGALSSSSLGSYLPWLLIAGGILLVVTLRKDPFAG